MGVLRSDPKVAGGAMTVAFAYETERHAKRCDTLGLPMVNLVDQPGNATGPEADLAGTLLGDVSVVTTIDDDARIPWLSISMRRAFRMVRWCLGAHRWPS